MLVIAVISEIFNYIAQSFVILVVCNTFFKPRFKKRVTDIISFTSYMIIITLNTVLLHLAPDNLLINLKGLIVVGIASLIYKDKFVKKIIVFIATFFIQLVTEFLAVLVLYAFYNDYIYYHTSILPLDYTHPKYYYRIAVVIICNIFWLLEIAILSIYKHRKKISTYSGDSKPLLKFWICFLVQAFIFIAYTVSKINSTEPVDLFLILLFTIVTIVLNLVLLKTLLEVFEKDKIIQQKKLIEAQIQGQYDYYQNLCNQMQYVRKLRHDISNNLQVINSLLDNGEIEKANEYTSKINKLFENSYLPVITENLILDTLLFNKTELAKNNRVNLKINCSTRDFGNISDEDLISVVSNILDNCLENCNSDITVSIANVSGLLLIKSENKIEQIEKHKSKEYEHGLGIQIIKDICEKYNGEFKYSVEENNFIATASLNANQKGE